MSARPKSTRRPKIKKRIRRPLTIIGWQERVDLPSVGLTNIKAKIDTGARTSALHAMDIERFERDGAPWVRFHTEFNDHDHVGWYEAPLLADREIKNTSGVPQERAVIRTALKIAGETWEIDLSLADRSNMKFRMIVGRASLKNHNVAVHCRKAHMTNYEVAVTDTVPDDEDDADTGADT